jgi:plasmid stabilization system protein ParE
MGNKIIVELTSRALKDLQKIRGFNDVLYGIPKSKEIINTVFKTIEILEIPDFDFTEIGSIDEDFVHLKYEYRKLIENHYKITYRKTKSKIYVVRVFDTRQNPNKNK